MRVATKGTSRRTGPLTLLLLLLYTNYLNNKALVASCHLRCCVARALPRGGGLAFNCERN